ISPQNTSPHPPLINIGCQNAEFCSATVRSSDRFCGHFVSGIHKAPECLAFVMSVGTISDQAPQVDDAMKRDGVFDES
ncbi:hypothetical protein, partial [Pseudophaeobacter arcticus]|uniref:hypothetical protein n=1 Tax=Pseudophaeobacter arcticus TaxID=385492 RepID=UPI0039E49D0E